MPSSGFDAIVTELDGDNLHLPLDLLSRRKWSRMDGPRVRRTPSIVESVISRFVSSNTAGSSDRCNSPKPQRNFPLKLIDLQRCGGAHAKGPLTYLQSASPDSGSSRKSEFE